MISYTGNLRSLSTLFRAKKVLLSVLLLGILMPLMLGGCKTTEQTYHSGGSTLIIHNPESGPPVYYRGPNQALLINPYYVPPTLGRLEMGGQYDVPRYIPGNAPPGGRRYHYVPR